MPGPASAAPFTVEARPLTQSTRGSLVINPEDCLPTAAHPYGAREGPYVIATAARVNALVKKFCSGLAAATNCLPQYCPHCNPNPLCRDVRKRLIAYRRAPGE